MNDRLTTQAHDPPNLSRPNMVLKGPCGNTDCPIHWLYGVASGVSRNAVCGYVNVCASAVKAWRLLANALSFSSTVVTHHYF
jgi:hypothetical protein